MKRAIKPDNPFPGMNPYMERSWGDVHSTLLILIRESLGEKLPADLLARAEESVSLEADDGWTNGKKLEYRVDVGISERWKDGLPPVWQPEGETSAVALANPLLVEAQSVEAVHRWLEIRESGGKLITIIEVLSPTNKTSKHQDYVDRRRRFEEAGVNYVEIDLLRGGGHAVAANDYSCRWDDGTAPDYIICVSRMERSSKYEVYRWRLRERLPRFRVPLRVTDPDIALDLQPLIDSIYRKGRYYMLDYKQALKPPLSAEDEAWSQACLCEAGLREG